MQATNRSGFTLVELIVSVTIFAIAITAVATPLVRVSGRASIQSQLVSESLLADVQRLLRNASSGYSSVAASEGVRNDRLALPEDYVGYFRSENAWTPLSSSYSLLETQNRKQAGAEYTRIISRQAKEYGGDRTYLKQIVLKKDDADTWVTVTNFAIDYRNPIGNCSFYFNSTNFDGEGTVVISEDSSRTINEFPKMAADPDYKIAELHFYDSLEKELFVAKIYKDKQFYVDMPDLKP